MVGCVPATYSFWSKFVIETSLYKSLRSAVSKITLITTRKSDHSQASRERNNSTQEYDGPYASYIKMEATGKSGVSNKIVPQDV